jgi:hypothetical protein
MHSETTFCPFGGVINYVESIGWEIFREAKQVSLLPGFVQIK